MYVTSNFYFFIWSITVPAYAKQIMLSAFIGLLIGLEREYRGKAASLKTFSTLAIGSCLFTILSYEAAGGAHATAHDITRIAAQIVTGIGFLGGGVIFKTVDRIEGITTGALVWFSAAMGMACGFNQIDMTLWALLIAILVHFVILALYRLIYYFRMRGNTVLL
jgi:putative Mg2+ transporter-C (MgtC) family protein